MAYILEGSILEVCDCNVLCPCWIGEDPDNGTCDSVIAYHVDRGEIEGVDVSGLTMAMVAHIPGNVLNGNFRTMTFVDDRASMEQEAALLKAFSGKLGDHWQTWPIWSARWLEWNERTSRSTCRAGRALFGLGQTRRP